MPVSRFLSAFVVACMLIASTAVTAEQPKPLVENSRVRVKRVDVGKGESVPDDNQLDMVTVRLQAGDTVLTEPGKTDKTDVPPYGDSHYFVAGTRRAVRNRGKQTLAFVEVQLLQPQGKYVAFEVPPSHYCNPGSLKACVTERYLYCTDRFCAETVTLDPGAASTQHTHDSDYMVIATSNFTWRNEPVGKPAVDETFKVGDVKYIDAGGTHRLVNTGGTTARLFVLQFK